MGRPANGADHCHKAAGQATVKAAEGGPGASALTTRPCQAALRIATRGRPSAFHVSTSAPTRWSIMAMSWNGVGVTRSRSVPRATVG